MQILHFSLYGVQEAAGSTPVTRTMKVPKLSYFGLISVLFCVICYFCFE
nr:MAG TPA: hypothetical protein [Caudoviricetes sp.]